MANASGSSASPPQRLAPISFLSIQQEQHEVASSSKAPPKSLVEIQAEEEKRAEEERQLARLADEKLKAEREEADFLRWWKREEHRIRKETKPVMGPPVGPPGRGSADQGSAGRDQTNEAVKRKRRGRGRGASGANKDEAERKVDTTPAFTTAGEDTVAQVQKTPRQQQRPRRPRNKPNKDPQQL